MSSVQVQQVIETKNEDSLTYGNFNNVIFLSHEEIVELLPLFKEECVYMREAYLENGVLHCSFNTFDYPFSKKSTKHFTRTHALLFVTQATYLLVSILSEHDQAWPLTKQKAVELAANEQMTFTSIKLNFRKFISNNAGIKLIAWMQSYRVIDNRLYGRVSFDFQKGCYGKCDGIVALDNSLKPI